jgi:hypothetical protein
MFQKIKCACEGRRVSKKEKPARTLKDPIIDFGKA